VPFDPLVHGFDKAPRRPRVFEVGRLRRVWFRTAETDEVRAIREVFGSHVPEAVVVDLWGKGLHLAPWGGGHGTDLIVQWGVVAEFEGGLREAWSWTVTEQPPPRWLGQHLPESARLLAMGGDDRLVVTGYQPGSA
jgi:hypothetical protein